MSRPTVVIALLVVLAAGCLARPSLLEMRQELLQKHGLDAEDIEDVMTLDRIQDTLHRGGDVMQLVQRSPSAARMLYRATHVIDPDQAELISDSDNAGVHNGAIKDARGHYYGEYSGDKTYVYLSKLAYDRSNPWKDGERVRFKQSGRDTFFKMEHAFRPSSGAEGMILTKEGTKDAYIMFRGSEKSSWSEFLKDWVQTNFAVGLVKACFGTQCVRGKAHRGFLTAYNSVRSTSKYMSTVTRLRSQGYRFHMGGHSLGGVLAIYAALDLSTFLNGNVRKVVTFGSPREGDATFASEYNARLGTKTTRYVGQYKTRGCLFDTDSNETEDEQHERHVMERMLKEPQEHLKLLRTLQAVPTATEEEVLHSLLQDSDSDDSDSDDEEDQADEEDVADENAWFFRRSSKKSSSSSSSDDDNSGDGFRLGSTKTGTDVVSKVPPQSMGYTHVAGEKLVTCHSCTSWCCSLSPSNLFLFVSCHKLDKYIEILNGSG